MIDGVKYTPVEYLRNGSPAAADIKAKEIFISKRDFPKYSEKQQYFILLHELGHIILDTKDEALADKFAIREYLKEHDDLSEPIAALEKSLGVNNTRKAKMIAEKPDLTYFNGGMDTLELYQPISGGIFSQKDNLSYFDPLIGSSIISGGSNLLGGIFGSFGAKDQARANKGIAENNLRSVLDTNTKNYMIATEQAAALKKNAEAKTQQTKIIILGLLGMVVIGVIAYTIIQFRKGKK